VKTLGSLVLAAAILAAPAARAQEQLELPKKWGSVEVGVGPYIPNIDHKVSGGRPYDQVFGGAPAPMFRIHVAKAVFSRVGTLEIGFKTGFWSKSGHAVTATGERTGDRAALSVLPTSATLTYRADFLWEQVHVPLVPYGRVALERYNWWTTKENKWTKTGATNGWSASAGLVLILDWLDPTLAREADTDVGIAHTGLYFDVTKSKVDDFGSKKSWDMSEKKLFWSGGLLVIF
jgi:hypothetical protein